MEDKKQMSSPESEFDDLIRNSLSSKKVLFPSSEEEFEKLLSEIDDLDLKAQSSINDVENIFKESSKSYLKKAIYVLQNEEYSLAARNGGKISLETIEKIKAKKDDPQNEKSEK